MKRHQHPPQPQLQPEEEQEHKNKHKNTKCSLNCINCTSVHLFLCESVTRGCTSQVMMAETTRGATTPWAVGPCYKSESSMVAARALAGFSSSWYRPWLMCAVSEKGHWYQSVLWGHRTYQQMKTFLKRHAKAALCGYRLWTTWWDSCSEI